MSNRSVSKLFVIMMVICVLVGCASKEKHETVEVYSVESLSDSTDSEGMYTPIGHKLVNAITIIEESKNGKKWELFVVEDHYDLDGDFMESSIEYGQGSKDFVTEHMTSDGDKMNSDKPLTILTTELIDKDFKARDLSDLEKEQVKKHILNLVATIEKK
ncbi:MAG: hypothetical protein ACE3L7_05350 [Candidatus Pristimantibacillus sp.]